MLKKTIKYTDFNDEEVQEDFYFHLSKAELIELELSHEGGLSEWLKTVIAANDGKTIMTEFKKIILSAYGQRSPDGRRFIKNNTLREEFESTEAYSVLFVELVTNAEAAGEFVRSVIPQDLAAEAANLVSDPPTLTSVPTPAPETITRATLERMSTEEVAALVPRISSGEVRLLEDDTPSSQ